MTGVAFNIGSLSRVQRIMSLSRTLSALRLSVFDGAATAYALRIPALSTYNGPLLRVRRSSDNAELDIGAVATADANGDKWLDTEALLNFCGVPTKPLDTVTGLAAAYSLRKLRTAYAGSATRVRRSSDNAEQDIGFAASGDLDTVALLAFVGSGNGFVVTWYDQSGNGRHATQTTQAAQPRIVNAGVVDTDGSRPCLVLNGTSRLITPTTLSRTAYPFASVNCVYRNTVINSGSQALWGGDGGAWSRFQLLYFGSATVLSWGISNGTAAVNQTTLLANTNRNVYSYISQIPGSSQIYVNGASGTSFTESSAGTFTSLTIGAINMGGDYQMTGTVSEFVYAFAALSTTNRQTLERSQAVYFGTSYTPTIPSAYVTTWYDQSGNGLHATTSDTTKQPLIANAGVLVTRNSRPALYSDSTTIKAQLTIPASPFAIGSVSLVGQMSVNGNLPVFYQRVGGIDGMRLDAGDVLSVFANGANTITTVASQLSAVPVVYTAVFADGNFYRNNAVAGTNTPSVPTSANANITLFTNTAYSQWMTGTMQELALFPSALSTDLRNSLCRSQGAAFGVTVA